MNDIDGDVNRRLTAFCIKRLATVLPPAEAERIRVYILALWRLREMPPLIGNELDWEKIAVASETSIDHLHAVSAVVAPGFDILQRAIVMARKIPGPMRGPRKAQAKKSTEQPARHQEQATEIKPCRRPGVSARPVEEFPEPLTTVWNDCADFADALNLHMRRHGDSSWRLYRAVVREGDLTDRKTFSFWRRGLKAPRTLGSLEILKRIERRYRLPDGYFRSKLPHPARASSGFSTLSGLNPAETRRLAWHLPDDFDKRPPAERTEILDWVRNTIINGSTDYRRFQAIAMKTRYALRFPSLEQGGPSHRRKSSDDEDQAAADMNEPDPDLAPGRCLAPPVLLAEVDELVSFKTATLTRFGYQRNGVWGSDTADQRLEHLGLLFGALAASPWGPVRGKGVPRTSLCLGLLAFPAVWDWYVQWREQRRGFYTVRQKNLRQLLLCPRGQVPKTERQLSEMRRGELRWSDREAGWEVFIPAVAFKNAHSSYFAGKPFRLILPDLGELYLHIDAYIHRHRRRLLRNAPDPGTFFVKTIKVTSRNATFDQTTFYEAWRLTIQRFGIYNPYTGRGVIRGLLPHGPHNVRDVLATHILKKTGSYEQASYAIQDTPDMVAKHYGRFLPQDKAQLAAQTLNLAWAA